MGRINHQNQAKHILLFLILVAYSLAQVPNNNSHGSVNTLGSTSQEDESAAFPSSTMKSADILKSANNHQILSHVVKPEDELAAAPEHKTILLPGIDDKALVNQVMSLVKTSKSNVDVITQAFRFVKLDAHLFTLLNQLNQLRESQDALQAESIKQQSKFDNALEEIKSLAANIAKESMRRTGVEERLESELEMMNDRMESVSEKIIQSSVSTQLLLDLSKETIQQTDKSVGISNEVLSELKSVRNELGDVGQASVQTIYNVQIRSSINVSNGSLCRNEAQNDHV